MTLEWKKFSDEMPKTDDFWVSDGKKVWLNNMNRESYRKFDSLWVWTEIELPKIPMKEFHCCVMPKGDQSFEWECREVVLNGKCYMELGHYIQTGEQYFVTIKFCPFCGYKPEEA
jgi:hypothetical protein